jgi:hypothetical protein
MDTASNRSIAAPLVFDDTSYRLARQEIGAGRLPAEADIRVEEFLAAIDYGLPSEQAATAALLLVAGPSPFEAPMDDMLRGRDAPTRWLLMIAAVPPAIEETLNAPPRLTVEFSAVRVSRYRVLGYAPPNSGGPHSEVGPTSDDPGAPPLLSGKAAVVLCEMETSETEHPDLEPVRVRLADMPEHALRREGAVRGNSAVLEPQMFYRDFASAPTVWRQAALVALAAELLAGSPFAQGASLTEVAALARQLEPSVSDQIGWRDFIETVSQAQSLRSSLRRAF